MSENGFLLPRARLRELITRLRQSGREVIAPTIADGAIVYDAIESDADLPIGIKDVQEPGKYRLEPRDDSAVFGHAVGPHSFKKLFHPAGERLYTVRREGGRLRFVAEPVRPKKLALLGARGCDLAALGVHDRVLGSDARYASRRSDVLIIAVNCGYAATSCFCTSMGTGPRVGGSWDLALTELLDGQHRFLVEVGSDAGRELVEALSLEAASGRDCHAAGEVIQHTATSITRKLDTQGIRELLQAESESPRWDEVAERCLACTNCTMVCPTCFCSTTEDRADVEGETAERERRWDSCFTLDFSHLHGGPVRSSVKARYRQWLTHKLSTWFDQFGESGCVGCGRCITWCPVGIDLTEEVSAIRQLASSPQE